MNLRTSSSTSSRNTVVSSPQPRVMMPPKLYLHHQIVATIYNLCLDCVKYIYIDIIHLVQYFSSFSTRVLSCILNIFNIQDYTHHDNSSCHTYSHSCTLAATSNPITFSIAIFFSSPPFSFNSTFFQKCLQQFLI